MVLFNIGLGVFAWTPEEDEKGPIFIKKFQNYLSEFLMNINDCKKLRNTINANYKNKNEILIIIKDYIKLKDENAFVFTSDSLFETWKSETIKQLCDYENKFKSFT